MFWDVNTCLLLDFTKGKDVTTCNFMVEMSADSAPVKMS